MKNGGFGEVLSQIDLNQHFECFDAIKINHNDLNIVMIIQRKNVSLEFLGFGMQIEKMYISLSLHIYIYDKILNIRYI